MTELACDLRFISLSKITPRYLTADDTLMSQSSRQMMHLVIRLLFLVPNQMIFVLSGLAVRRFDVNRDSTALKHDVNLFIAVPHIAV